MAVEPIAKRRKLNHAAVETPDQSLRPDSSSRSQRQGRSTPARSAKSKDITPGQTRHASSCSLEVQDSAGNMSQRRIVGDAEVAVSNEEREPEDMGDEIVVRSSGRVRRVSAKLRQSVSVTTSRAGTPQAASQMRSPMSSVARRKEIPAEQPRKPVEDGAARKRQTSKIGKENMTPPSSAEPVRDSLKPFDLKARTKNTAQTQVDKVQEQRRPVEVQMQMQMQLATPAQKDTAQLELSSESLKTAQHALLKRATGQETIALLDLKEEYAKVSSLIRQAVEVGESNSMLVIGSRGTGKSALVNQALHAQQETCPNDFHVVRLNGFVHTDDKLALRDIWRQLGREMEVDEKEMATKSYADILSMLLALLSHPTELGQITKSVIFILDEFDLFATHPRQTLLYNLFDIAQSRKAPIAVLGLTTRIDVVEALEKRVKSRFSHRYVHLAPAKSLTAFTQICRASMEVSDKAWNNTIHSLFDKEDFGLHIRKIYYRSKSVPDFLTTMLMPLGLLVTDESVTRDEIIEHFLSTTSMSALGSDSKLDLLPSLSTLQLALLVCAARQNAIYATENVPFNLAYEEYKSIAGKAKLQATASGAMGAGSRVWGKDVARNAWSDLLNLGLIIEDGRGIGKVDITLEEIADSGVELGQLSRYCREI